MADEVRQKFEAWAREYLGNDSYLIYDADRPTWTADLFAAYQEGKRAGEIARWIPVEEKLPEKAGIVICYGIRASGQPTMQMTTFFAGAFDMEDQGYLKPPRVTHWQPLPAAPEQGNP